MFIPHLVSFDMLPANRGYLDHGCHESLSTYCLLQFYRVASPVTLVFLTGCRGESLATVATEPLAVLVDAGSASASEAGGEI